MNISLDFDKTYTEDPVLWDAFIMKARLRGHDIRIVTFRSPDIPIERELGIPVIYTAYIPKREYTDKMGWHVDVWIDDSPEIITEKSMWTDKDRERWAIEKKKQDEIILNRLVEEQGSSSSGKDDSRIDVC